MLFLFRFFSLDLPDSAKSAAVRFRFWQPENQGVLLFFISLLHVRQNLTVYTKDYIFTNFKVLFPRLPLLTMMQLNNKDRSINFKKPTHFRWVENNQPLYMYSCIVNHTFNMTCRLSNKRSFISYLYHVYKCILISFRSYIEVLTIL